MANLTTETQVQEAAARVLQLLPPGAVWNRSPDSVMGKFWAAFGVLVADVQNRGLDILDEVDTRTVEELIAAWEGYLGLPDPDCSSRPGTALLRRFAVHAKHTNQGGQSPQFYIDLAAAVGFTITVEEFLPYVVGGPSAIGNRLYTDPWRFTWRVHAPVHTVTFARAGKLRAGESIAYSDNTILECTLEAVKPAHTNLVFEYDLPYQGTYAPWSILYPSPVVLELHVPQPVISGQAP